MWYTTIHANSTRDPTAHGGRAGCAQSRPPLGRGLYGPPLSVLWPVPRASTAPSLPPTWGATSRRSARRFTRSTDGGCRPSTQHLPGPIGPRPSSTPRGGARLRALLHQSPRLYGRSTSVWTLALAAEVSYAEGLTPRQVSGEAIRLALKRLGVRWRRAKPGSPAPTPRTKEKKGGATA